MITKREMARLIQSSEVSPRNERCSIALSSTSSATRLSTGPGVGVGGRVGVAMIWVSLSSDWVDETVSSAELVASVSTVVEGVAIAGSDSLLQAVSSS